VGVRPNATPSPPQEKSSTCYQNERPVAVPLARRIRVAVEPTERWQPRMKRRAVTVFDFDTCIRQMTPQRLGMVQRHKLIYFAYRTYVIGTGKVPFKNKAEAWPLGPVFPELQEHPDIKGDASALDELMRNCCRDTLETFGHLSGTRMVQFSHARCGEWQVARLFVKPGKRGGVIQPSLIKKVANNRDVLRFCR
jgi:uncharacterized phage-associated protein